MFKWKGGKQDSIHQTNIRRGITSHFARTLKILQQRHLQSGNDEVIYSDDKSNNLCNALEAAFLHGLKDSVAQKLTAYVGLAPTQDTETILNFWNVAAKFTHKDVITQLRGLSQINTEIGLCRAWVRLALNDGLMESYLHSMIVDVKTLKYYYHSNAFLRDHEQPGILKNYLTGLMSLEFRLSNNSSVLNAWNNSTLQLVGALDVHSAPPPSIPASSQAQHQTGGQVHSLVSGAREREKDEDDGIICNKKSIEPVELHRQSDRVGAYSPMFSSIQDVDSHSAISCISFTPSEGSTSSQISCPDPSGTLVGRERPTSGSALVIYPTAGPVTEGEKVGDLSLNSELWCQSQDRDLKVETSGTENSAPLREVEDVKSSIYGRGSTVKLSSPVITEHANPTDLAFSPRRPRSRRVDNEDLRHLSSPVVSPNFKVDKSVSELESTERILEVENPPQEHVVELAEGNDVLLKPSPSERSRSSSPQVDRSRAKTRTYEEICATLPPLDLDPLEQDAILRKVLKEIDEQADKDRERREAAIQKQMEESREVNRTGLDVEKRNQKMSNSKTKLSFETENFTPQTPQVVSKRSNPVDSKSSSEQTAFPASQGIAMPSTLSVSNRNDSRTDNVAAHPGEQSTSHTQSHSSPEHEANTQNAIDNGQHARTTMTVRGEALQNVVVDCKPANNLDMTNDECENALSSSHLGNSLSGKTGWSSQIESRTQEKSGESRNKEKSESFASMLTTYSAQSGQQGPALTSMQEILDGLSDHGDDEDDGDGTRSKQPSPESDSKENFQEQALDDFEILQSPVGSCPGQINADSSRMIFLYRVPREHGLSHQNFTCRGCACPIGIIYGAPRLCEFDGGLYCLECHGNNETYVPSSILFNWDFRKKKVCLENYKFLQELEDQPLYDLDSLSPRLYMHVAELQILKVLRQQMCYLKSYLFTCSQKVAELLRQKVWPREHLYEQLAVYSISDLLQVQSGVLQRLLKDIVKFASQHVYDCPLCCQKGFICEICHSPKVIYPFEIDTTIRCTTCKAVYHSTCMTDSLPCPKCERWGKRISGSARNSYDDNPEDYGMSPPL